MVTLTEGQHTGEFIGEMALGANYHNDVVTLLSGEDLGAGTVLGKITASGKYVQHDPAAADGSQNAAAILLDNEHADGADAEVVVVIRGPMTVNGNKLVWASGITDNQKNTAKTALLALGIRVL